MVARRRKSYQERDDYVNRFNNEYVRITGGSKAEGFSSCFETDYDRLNFSKNAICICGQCQNVASETQTVFKLNGKRYHPGHFYLELLHLYTENKKNCEKQVVSRCDHYYASPTLKESQEGVISMSLVFIDGQLLLSSDKFMQGHETNIQLDTVGGWKKGDISGPSIPSTRGLYRRDDVYAFRCPCQRHLLADWAIRRRQFGWPSHELIDAVLETNAHVVPVGCHGSQHKDMEWRICFGERILSGSFNETQMMLYVVLKMINTTFITPVCNNMSSYIMKNITFWIVEGNPAELFTAENLLHLVEQALIMLKTAVHRKHLSYYMLKQRNLLQGRISDQEQSDLLEVLTMDLSDVSKLVLKLPKVFKALRMPLECLIADGKVRDELESLELYRQEIIAFYWRPYLKREEVDELCWRDENYREARLKMYNIVWPNWSVAFCQGNGYDLGNLVAVSTKENMNVFNERYLRFAESYYDIIWPHMKRCIQLQTSSDLNSIPKENIVNFMAVMRLKIEQALA